jgi:hypothetical protein
MQYSVKPFWYIVKNKAVSSKIAIDGHIFTLDILETFKSIIPKNLLCDENGVLYSQTLDLSEENLVKVLHCSSQNSLDVFFIMDRPRVNIMDRAQGESKFWRFLYKTTRKGFKSSSK